MRGEPFKAPRQLQPVQGRGELDAVPGFRRTELDEHFAFDVIRRDQRGAADARARRRHQSADARPFEPTEPFHNIDRRCERWLTTNTVATRPCK